MVELHSALSNEAQLSLLQTMLEIRRFEEAVEQVFARGLGRGTTHLCIGQEAVAVGACAALQPDDYVTSTHRGHGHCIARGLDPRLMMAEIYGKSSGYCKGKGGSMHIADINAGVLGANGIVGAGIPIAVGAALSAVIRETNQVVLCFFGDGAVAGGSFHEAVNLASVWNLPVVFLCENNLYAMSLSIQEAIAACDVANEATAYGIPGVCIDGNDVLAVYEAASSAVDRARERKGPTLIEAKTYRWRGHSRSDARLYRTPEEEEQWRERDPIRRFADQLITEGLLSTERLDALKEHAARLMEEAVTFAECSPYPAAEELTEDIYV
jgi:pyruvate dehydrogenase E1 component alpha subunit